MKRNENNNKLIYIHTTKSSVSVFPITEFGLGNKIFFSIENMSNLHTNHVYAFESTNNHTYEVYETNSSLSLINFCINRANIVEFFSALQILRLHKPEGYDLNNCLIRPKIDMNQMMRSKEEVPPAEN